MNPQAIQLVIWLFGGLLARTVDTVIGGGDLFSVPALLLIGRSSQATLGTNQLALSFGALAGTVKFSQKGILDGGRKQRCVPLGYSGGHLRGMTTIAIPAQILDLDRLIDRRGCCYTT